MPVFRITLNAQSEVPQWKVFYSKPKEKRREDVEASAEMGFLNPKGCTGKPTKPFQKGYQRAHREKTRGTSTGTIDRGKSPG